MVELQRLSVAAESDGQAGAAQGRWPVPGRQRSCCSAGGHGTGSSPPCCLRGAGLGARPSRVPPEGMDVTPSPPMESRAFGQALLLQGTYRREGRSRGDSRDLCHGHRQQAGGGGRGPVSPPKGLPYREGGIKPTPAHQWAPGCGRRQLK